MNTDNLDIRPGAITVVREGGSERNLRDFLMRHASPSERARSLYDLEEMIFTHGNVTRWEVMRESHNNLILRILFSDGFDRTYLVGEGLR